MNTYPIIFRKIIVLSFFALGLLLSACATTHVTKEFDLIRAAEKGETTRVITLVKAGANVNARDGEGWTPYLAAASNGHMETMHFLESVGAAKDVGF